MNCNCSWMELVLALVILIFVLWPTQVFSATVSMWLVVIAALLIAIHALFCTKCGGVCMGMMKGKSKGRKK